MIINILLITISTVLLVLHLMQPETKILYVDNAKVFENFSMTKELKKNGEKEFNNRKANLDVLYSQLESTEISSIQKQTLMKQFIKEKEELNQFNDFYSSEQTSKIWTRIKSYSAEFSKENDCDIIISSDSNGNVLFADQSIDITDKLITYINQKYEGLK
ncbi:OmpH family outer membrane protein [Flavobacterium sp. KACC 22763]|uniref:OmpH family outer membrane protein n=1 Tax=Flavobacterium sp. KACC 22763 TaxID=3025668 RepID=UPI002365524E|nr:OmpH family outer membrane protein [Flavobacterium sp. KACC 22763]WDF66481.1 OmpH family outer membrane protein [Flavobacterium sp. KACC 22763]